MTDIETKAFQFALESHRGQVRKYTDEPYINHPMNVANWVRIVGGDENMIAAAYLHDVVEDCEFREHADVYEEFGYHIGRLVSELTDVSRTWHGNRARRKEIDRQWISGASPAAKTIKLADLIDNSKSILKHDPKFAKVYMNEKRLLLEVLDEGNQDLYKQATEIVEKYYESKA